MRAITIGMALLLMFVVSTAQAQIMAEHVGANDPTTEMAAYWRAETHPYYNWQENGDPGGGADPNGLIPSWRMVKSASDATRIGAYYTKQIHKTTDSPPFDFDQFLDPGGWVATILVKVNYAHSTGHAVIFALEDGRSVIRIHVVNNPDYTLSNGLNVAKAAPTQYWKYPEWTAADWTLFNVVCNANDNSNPNDDVFSIYANGNYVDSYDRSEFAVKTDDRDFSFGRTATAAYPSDQEYALWRIEFGQQLPFPLAGDVDGDLWIGNKDLNLIIENWGSTTYPAGDFDNDGTIDEDDYQIILDNWGTGLLPPKGIVGLAPPSPPGGHESETASLGFLLTGMLLRPPARRRRSKKPLLGMLLVIAFVFCGTPAFAQTFAWTVPGYGGSAISWGDYNNDGLVDAYAGFDLLRNNGGSWTHIVSAVDGELVNTVWGDYDNDGLLDLYSQVENIMYRNLGIDPDPNGFDDAAITMPAHTMADPVAGSFADLDNNGYIDVYIAGGAGTYEADTVLMNSGGTSFTNTWTSPTALPGRGATSCDFDRDGDQDVYVSNYWLAGNYLWLNDGSGDFNNFSDVATAYGATGGNGHSIGSAWGDLDNDGDFDLFAGNFNHAGAGGEPPSLFLRNQGFLGVGNPNNYHFVDMAPTASIATGVEYASPALADYDNDGDLDLFITTATNATTPSALYQNDGSWGFTDVTATAGLTGIGTISYQAAWADIDNDGDLDLATDGGLLRNDLNNSNHWLKVNCVGNGTTVNSAAIGTQVRISVDHDNNAGTADIIVTRQVEGGTGANGNQNDLTLHFGLGLEPSSTVDLDILWPDGSTQTVTDVPVDSLFTFNQSQFIAIEEVAGAPAGYKAYDIKLAVSTMVGPLELTVETDNPGDIYQVSLADDPDVAADEFDTYVTTGTVESPTGANPPSTLILGNAEAIDPAAAQVFDDQNINIAWAWDPSVVDMVDFSVLADHYGALDLSDLADLATRWLQGYTLGAGEYQIARIILKDTATNAKITVVGMRTGSQEFVIKTGP